MVERYEGVVWAEGVRVERVVVCRMGAVEVEGDGGKEYFVEGGVEV